MGVDARLVVYAPDKTAAETACIAAFARIAALDAMMSDYRRESELMRLCDHAGGPPVKVSAEISLVLRRAQEISRLSGGAFDVTVGPLVKLWREARKKRKLPATGAIAAARKLVGWRNMVLDQPPGTVRLARKGMRLDLGAIAKGYAVDEVLRTLRARGIRSALVDMGDIGLGEPPPGKQGWRIRIPDAGGDFVLSHCVVSTSGDLMQHLDIGGMRYSHVVNPHTGYALTNGVEATVIAPSGLLSDPLSTCMTLLGARARARLLKHYPGTRAFASRDN